MVTGAAGQDGWYLLKSLLARGYVVHAQSRKSNSDTHLGPVDWHCGSLTDADFLEHLIVTARPNEIYNLASVSRPLNSWNMPHETLLLNALVPQQIFELVRRHQPTCRVFQATSSEIFGNSNVAAQNEDTPLQPQTPYGISKLSAHLAAGAFRRHYDLHISSGIMFNHESPRRPLSYVSQKIAHAAAAAALGLRETAELDEHGRPILKNRTLRLGNLDIRRDFGFAGDYVECMHLMLQSDTADDYVIGTGESHSIREFCEIAFRRAGLDWKDHVAVDETLVRKVDSYHTTADISKVAARLGWRRKTSFTELVTLMVDERMRLLSGELSKQPGQRAEAIDGKWRDFESPHSFCKPPEYRGCDDKNG